MNTLSLEVYSMTKEKLSLALIYGGRGLESRVSISGMEHILPLLREDFDLMPIFIDSGGRWLYRSRRIFPAHRGFISESGEMIGCDVALPLLHGDFGEDGRVQGALECADIAYVGCDVAASALCRDKSQMKLIARHLGIPTLPHLLLSGGDTEGLADACESRFDYPIFIKPTSLGSSFGCSRADDRESLTEAIRLCLRLCNRAIAEPCLCDKRELECGYYRAESKEIFTFPGEILVGGSYTYEKKYLSQDSPVCPRADVTEDVAEKIREYTRRLIDLSGVRDIARVDYFLSGGELYFNEINTMPGFTCGSLYAMMLGEAGIPEGELLSGLIRSAYLRSRGEG